MIDPDIIMVDSELEPPSRFAPPQTQVAFLDAIASNHYDWFAVNSVPPEPADLMDVDAVDFDMMDVDHMDEEVELPVPMDIDVVETILTQFSSLSISDFEPEPMDIDG